MKVYLAASYAHHPIMAEFASKLQELDIEVTSRWIYGYHEMVDDSDAEAFNAWCATEDLEDVIACNVFVHFNIPGSLGRGGRHIELGFALALGKKIVLVGARENVFHYLPCIIHRLSEGEALTTLTVMNELGSSLYEVFVEGKG